MNYTTQMDAARKKIITPQMQIVAEKEGIPIERLMQLMAKGQVIIPCNKRHNSISPNGIGSMLRTKINVNLEPPEILPIWTWNFKKVQSAVDMGAEAIMDLSSFGDTRAFRRKLAAQCPAMIGTVPIYDAVVYYHKPLFKLPRTNGWK